MMGKDPCTEAETPAGKFKFCQGQPPVPLGTSVPANNTGTSPPPVPPKDSSIIEKSYESTNTQSQIRLDSIVGNWNFAGRTHDGMAQFSGSTSFGENNEFSARIFLNGYEQPARYGSYSYSASDSTVTIHFIGSPPMTYSIDSMTEDSFNTISEFETAFYVRI